jgi:histidine ammonia-lyase
VTILLGEARIGIAEVVAVARHRVRAALAPAAARRLDEARAVLDDWSRQDRPVYGLTRGLGNRATQAIPEAERRAFSETALKARATGAGGYFPPEVARAALFVRAATLARGGAGVRPVVVETQLAMLARGGTPLVPRGGSVGTSDLLVCATLGLPGVGLGRADYGGTVLPGADAMRRAGVPTIELAEKEGLALCSSNAVSVGLGALAAHDARELVALAEATLAMSYEAFGGNPAPSTPASPPRALPAARRRPPPRFAA